MGVAGADRVVVVHLYRPVTPGVRWRRRLDNDGFPWLLRSATDVPERWVSLTYRHDVNEVKGGGSAMLVPRL